MYTTEVARCGITCWEMCDFNDTQDVAEAIKLLTEIKPRKEGDRWMFPSDDIDASSFAIPTHDEMTRIVSAAALAVRADPSIADNMIAMIDPQHDLSGVCGLKEMSVVFCVTAVTVLTVYIKRRREIGM